MKKKHIARLMEAAHRALEDLVQEQSNHMSAYTRSSTVTGP